jgi:hypothetical protein
MDDTLPRYKGWAAEASLYVSIDVLQVHTGARHSALEGHTPVTATALLVLVACALQRLALLAEEEEPPIYLSIIEDFIESFSFSEIANKSLAARLCTVLCDTHSDRSTLLEVGGIILPLG